MKKKTLVAITAAISVAAAVLSGCSATPTNETMSTTVSTVTAEETKAVEETEAETRTIIDHAGNEVILPAELNRVVISGLLPLPSVFVQFRGSAEEIVGMHPSSMAAAENSYLVNIFPDITEADTSFVVNGAVNIEELMKLDPDVVYYSATNVEEYELYKKAGIPAVGFSTTIADYDCVETYAAWIDLFGDIYGEQEAADAIIAEGRQVAEEIISVTSEIPEEEKPRVMIIMNYANGVMKVVGSNFFSEYWIDSAGGINVAADLNSSNEVNMEQVYEWDPDMIFITNFSPYLAEDILNNTIDGYDWSNVKAVKEGKVYKFPLGMYRWFPPASDTPLVLQWLAKMIQPEAFADLDMDNEIKEFYKTHYHVDLTDTDLEMIYNPTREASGVALK
ncbi:MAG: Fe3+-citrate ABC transporter substrate-binding protein [Lachnoclostridium sp.]|nr:Fe3+-citrate ABC transporter substrate-binding protein [Lachnoclostridium sp.]